MNWDLAMWLTGTALGVLGLIFGGRHISRGASGVTQNVDPNQQLISVLASQGEQIKRLNEDADRAKIRMSDVEQRLATETERGQQHTEQIQSLQTENQHLHNELATLQRVVVAWETWHRWLVAKWHEIRLDEQPPDGPQVTDPN